MSTWYRAGTVTVTNGQTTVTGAGTAWVGAVNVGDGIVLPDGRTYEVVQIVSATSLTLATPYLGTTASGQAYAVIPTRGLTVEFNQNAVALLSLIQNYVDTVLAGRFGNGDPANPSISFGARPTTGLSLIPGANAAAAQVVASVNGVSRLRLTNTGGLLDGLLTGTAVTQSAIDTTVGRLMKVGDFGLGSSAPATPPGGDVNSTPFATNLGGFHTSGVLDANAPFLWAQYITLARAGDRGAQIALETISPTTPRMAIRTRRTDGSSPWSELFHRLNILGTVSQIGGVPNGALFQPISGPNGTALRLPDGTQICWSSDLTLETNLSDQSMITGVWTFPVGFISAPNVIMSPRINATVFTGFGLSVSQIRNRLGLASGQNTTTPTQTELNICYAEAAPIGAQMSGQRAQAIGRWF